MPSSARTRDPGRRSAADRGVGVVCGLVALGVAAGAAWMLLDVAMKGSANLSPGYLLGEPEDAGRSGGIGSVVVSTLLVLGTCVAIAFPLGLGTAVWLSEVARPSGWAARHVGRSLDLLATVPSIVFGLFGMVFFCEVLGFGFSILAGGCTLATMILPILVQASYVGLRSAPPDLRPAAAALGLGPWTTIRRLLIPAASPAITVGLLLGIGRALAETAALVFTSGYVTRMPESLFDSGRTLSVHVFDLSMNVPGGERAASSAALVLLVILGLVNEVARRVSSRWLRGGEGPTGASA